MSGHNETANEALQPKRAAVLAYLAAAEPGPWHRRDTLLALFWPESGNAAARNTLRQVTHHLRRVLGSTAVTTRGLEELSLSDEVVWSDVRAFNQAVQDGRYEEAADLYRGHLLEGFHVSNAYGFEDWLDRERDRLRRRAVDMAWTLSEAATGRGDHAAARRWAYQACDWAPSDEGGIRRLVQLLDHRGEQTEALRVYGRFERYLRGELGLEPAAESRRLAERLREACQGDPTGDRVPMPRMSVSAGEDTPRDGPLAMVGSPPAHGSSKPTRRVRWTLLLSVAAAVSAVFVIARAAWDGPNVSLDRPQDLSHIAVLPFDNVSADPANAFYADALHNEVIARIRRIDGLAVRPRSSVLQYGESDLPLSRVAKELAVSHVLEAAVQVSGERLRVTLRLTEGETELPLWLGDFEADLSSAEHLFSVQDSIASSVADALRLEFDATADDRPTTSEVAYTLFLESLGASSTVRGNLEATTLLRQAIAFDPEFAQARGQIAFRYASMVQVMGDDRALADSAELHATRAIQLDSTYAFGWFALAQARFNQGRLDGALDAYNGALAASPTWINPLGQRGWLLFMTGKLDEAADDYVSALWLEPNVRVTLTSIASLLLTIGDHERADRWLQAAEGVIPDHPATRATRMTLLAQQGRWDEGRQAGEAWIRLAPANQFAHQVSARVAFARGDFTAAAVLAEQARRLSPGARSAPGLTAETVLGASLIRSGRVAEGTAVLRSAIDDGLRSVANGEQRPGPQVEIAAAYAGLGEVDAAIEWLESASEAGWRHSDWAPSGMSQFSTIAAEPRFESWLEREREAVEDLGARIRSKHSTTLDAFLRRWYELNPVAPRDEGSG